jgi:hypothetical protein
MGRLTNNRDERGHLVGKPLRITFVLAWIACCGGCRQVCEWTDDFSCAIDACTLGKCIQPIQPSTCLTSPHCPAVQCDEGTKELEVRSCKENSLKENACEKTGTATLIVKKQECDVVAPIMQTCPILRLGMNKTKHRAHRPEPTIAYEPPMPPKFLLVPTEKVFSKVNMLAPTPRRGDVEVNFGPQLNIPSHD